MAKMAICVAMKHANNCSWGFEVQWDLSTQHLTVQQQTQIVSKLRWFAGKHGPVGMKAKAVQYLQSPAVPASKCPHVVRVMGTSEIVWPPAVG
jgi:hypothetical protein